MEAGGDAGAVAGAEEIVAPVVIPFISLAAVRMDSPIAVVDHEQGISLPVKDFPGLVHRVKHYLKENKISQYVFADKILNVSVAHLSTLLNIEEASAFGELYAQEMLGKMHQRRLLCYGRMLYWMDYKATYAALHLSESKLSKPFRFKKPRRKRSDGKSQNRVSKSNYTAKPRTLLEAIKRKRNDSTGQGGDITDDEGNLGNANVAVNDWNIDAEAGTILTGDQFSQHLETGANLEQVEILLDGDNSFIAAKFGDETLSLEDCVGEVIVDN